ncbi:30S ribosomal protein S4e [Candidatus Bathyarchaeota archaeon]|nr:30S ribosomal protein S4e [Candidatus Bathyarchaeota archaeon]
MGSMGGRRHLKREASPDFWPIHRKKFTWIIKPNPGPHPISQCIPLGVIVRDHLSFAKTMREAKKIISQGKILVDGRDKRDEHFPVGLMDVITIPEINANYRVLPWREGLILYQISEEEAKYKICRIENKTTLNSGHMQLNLHDGRNILIRSGDPRNPAGNVFQTLDSLKIEVPDQRIIEHLSLDLGKIAVIIGGKNAGKYGVIKAIEKQEGQKKRNSLVTIRDSQGEDLRTILDYIFVIGEKTPIISLPKLERVQAVS